MSQDLILPPKQELILPRAELDVPHLRLIGVTDPFATHHVDMHIPAGLTLLELAAYAGIPEPLLEYTSIAICDPELKHAPETVYRDYWHRVRPRPGMTIAIRVAPGKKKKGGGKGILGLIFTIAIIAAAAWAGPALAAGLGFVTSAGALTTFGTILGGVFTATIGFVGQLAMTALIGTPRQPGIKNKALAGTDNSQAASYFSITGAQNQANPYGPIPRLYGRVRVWPYFAAKPYTEIVGADQYLRMAFLLGFGPLQIDESTFKIGESFVDQFEGFEYEIRQGYDDDPPLTLYTNSPRQEDLTVEIKNDGIRTPAVSATGEITFANNPTNGQTVTIGARVYQFENPLTVTANRILRGANAAASAANLRAALNRQDGAGLTYSAATLLNADISAVNVNEKLTVTAKTAGIAANSIALASTVTGSAWTHATLTGGAAPIMVDVLTEDEKWISRNSKTETDELSVDITFKNGLVHFTGTTRTELTVRFDIRYRSLSESPTVWQYVSTASNNTFTLTGNMADGETITVGTRTYTIKNPFVNAANNVARGASAQATLLNLESAINGGPGLGTAYGTGTVRHEKAEAALISASQLKVSARHLGNTTGPDGDTITTTETSATGSWLTPTLAGGLDAISVTGKDTNFRVGKRWKVGTQGQYEVAFRRLTVNSEADDDFDDSFWTALRSIQYVNPVLLKGLALIAVRVLATDQLNGIIDTFNCIVTAMLPKWVSGALTAPQPTRTPAWAYVNELRGSHVIGRASDDSIDWDEMALWADDSESLASDGEPKHCFDGAFTDFARVKDRLLDIASTGRASPSKRNDKHSIVRDVQQTVPVAHIGVDNSYSFKGSRRHIDPPHAVKVKFTNELSGYQPDELIVYADGYTKDNANLFESMEFPFVLRKNQIWRDTRYHMAVSEHRPEDFVVDQDIESIAAFRGALVQFNHDAALAGISSKEIKSLELDEDGNLIAIILNGEIQMEDGLTYALRIRRRDGSSQVVALLGGAFIGARAILAVAIPPGAGHPNLGDMAFFGETDRDSIQTIITRIEPHNDFSATISMQHASWEVLQADQGEIPPFDPGITEPVPFRHRKPDLPIIENIASDESVLSVQPDGGYHAQIVITFGMVSTGAVPPSFIEGQVKRTGSDAPWSRSFMLSAGQGFLTITGVDSNETYDIRARNVSAFGTFSDWLLQPAYRVIGDTSLPPVPLNPRVSGRLFLWDYPSPPRDFVGGGFLVKAIAGTVPDFDSGFFLYDGVVTSTQYDFSALTNGVYMLMVKAQDRSGNKSDDTAFWQIDTGTPQVFNAVAEISLKALEFPGVITGGAIDSVPAIVAELDDEAFWPADLSAPAWSTDPLAPLYSAQAQELTYTYAFWPGTGDAGSTLKIAATVTGAPWTIRYSEDGGLTFLPWPSEIIARDIEYSIQIVTQGGDIPGRIEEVRLIYDVPDQEENTGILTIPPGGMRLPLTKGYRFIVHVSPTLIFVPGETAVGFYFADYDPVLGPLVYAIDQTAPTPQRVTGTGSFHIFGAENV